MAKVKAKRNVNSETVENGSESQKDTPKYQAPEGYVDQSSDLVGFWNPAEGPLHFIPRSAKLVDSQLDKTKVSILIVGELMQPTDLTAADGDMSVHAKRGDLVGVWGKP